MEKMLVLMMSKDNAKRAAPIGAARHSHNSATSAHSA